jgi:UDP-N-acetylmuramate--alanine ligase
MISMMSGSPSRPAPPSAGLEQPAASDADAAHAPFDLHRPDVQGRRLHFVGIGGCGMSGLAHMAAKLGGACSGSDLGDSPVTRGLRDAGIAVGLQQTAEALPDDTEVLVISAAIKPDHPEVAEALRRGLTVIKYAQLLGALMIGRTGVAVAGTHGKSTTTSLLCHILIEAGLDPSFIVGANCAQIGGGWRVSEDQTNVMSPRGILVAEACEYDRSFHNFHPTHGLILNVEADHLDLYRNLDEIVESFAVFAQRIAPNGSLLINHEMGCRLDITAGLDCTVETLGFAPQADWTVEAGDRDQGSGIRVRLRHEGEAVASWRSPMPGEHMAYNAAAAAITAHRLGAAWDDIRRAVESFQGLDRRMQVLGQLHAAGDPVTVIDDYGHHPTEIDTTLRALRQHYHPDRLICIFQPHQHSRTRFLMEQFAVSFEQADVVLVPDIYFVRDSQKERQAVTAGDLVDRLRHQGVSARHMHPFETIVEHVRAEARAGDLIVTMGAGDVWKISHALLDTPAPSWPLPQAR